MSLNRNPVRSLPMPQVLARDQVHAQSVLVLSSSTLHGRRAAGELAVAGHKDLIFKECSIPLPGCHHFDVERTVLMVVFDGVEEVLIIEWGIYSVRYGGLS